MAAAVTGPVKVRMARYLKDSGVFTSRPEWDKSGSLLSCEHHLTPSPADHAGPAEPKSEEKATYPGLQAWPGRLSNGSVVL